MVIQHVSVLFQLLRQMGMDRHNIKFMDESISPTSPLISPFSDGLHHRNPWIFPKGDSPKSRHLSGVQQDNMPVSDKEVIYEIPNKPRTLDRKRRKVRRMPSCPAGLKVVPAEKPTTKGRFVVSTIPEETTKEPTKHRESIAKVVEPKEVTITIGDELVKKTTSPNSTSEV